MPHITSSIYAAFAALLFATAAGAQERLDRLYCAERDLGVYFYCEPPQADQDPAASSSTSLPAMSATEKAERIRAEVEEARATAVLNPTPQNVASYIRVQRAQLDRATLFADVWRRVIWSEPDLDYTLQRPVGQLAKRIWLSERTEDRTAAVRAVSDRYGLFYFYSSTCGACQAFSPVLRAFADAHDLAVQAVSVDGGPSPYFPNAVTDQGQMAKMGLSAAPTPTVVLFDSDTNDVTPIAFGIVSASDLADRILLLTTTEPGDDF